MKTAVFHRAAGAVIQRFPDTVKKTFSGALEDLKQGIPIGMPLSRPMPSVTHGAFELRIKDASGTYRVFYYTKSRDAIMVFHAFVKKSQKTPRSEIAVGRQRLKELLREAEIQG